jgi:pantoate--beta-alanine ligase
VTAPALLSSTADVRGYRAAAAGKVAFVPTMGALHDGHASLMKLARETVGPEGTVIVSIFVNPLQFGAGEDLDRYPRTLDADLKIAEREAVDAVFAPGVEDVYPGGEPQVRVTPGPLADILEGAVREGHFGGVLTVVAKLFGLVQPDVAIFGEKDYQQLALIRRMVTDLNMPIEIIGAPTEREPDGLALSSRNVYLSAEDRALAANLSKALRAGQAAAADGAQAAQAAAEAVLAEAGITPDYLVVTGKDLGEAGPGEGRMLIAARVGTTRLIDNVSLNIGG